tara:strand:+ start:907 stop:1272 length:366 start_codon:yes stop_codon:yes gene_type:complete
MGLANSAWATALSNPLIDTQTQSKVQTFSDGAVHDITDAARVGNAVSTGYYFVRISNTGANNLRVTPNSDGTAGDLLGPGASWEQAIKAGVKIYTIGTAAQTYNATAFYPVAGQVGSASYT